MMRSEEINRAKTIDGVSIRIASAEEIIDLRHRILRQDLPRSEAMFAGDDLPTSGHFAAFAHGAAVCCATFFLSRWNDQPAFQLRGMATDDAYRGLGLGKVVLRMGETVMSSRSGIRQFWCNARLIAVPFYQKQGWTIQSEQFHIPTAGPHHRMAKNLDMGTGLSVGP